MIDAPREIWDFWPIDGGAPVVWRDPCPFPADDAVVFHYIRADALTLSDCLAVPEVRELVEAHEGLKMALTEIDALDPEHLINSCAQTALIGLVLRMGEIARAALRKLEGGEG